LKKTIIIGLGNILLSDEGIGVHILNNLKTRNPLKSCTYLDLGTSSFEIINFIDEHVNKMIIIDCLNSKDHKPGSVIQLTIDDILNTSCYKLSLHQIKLIDSLKILSIETDIPESIIIGIVPFDMITYSTSLSDHLSKQLEYIVFKIQNIITNFLAQ